MKCIRKKIFNPFDPNAHFFYPLKTSETLFQWVEKGALGMKWVKQWHTVGLSNEKIETAVHY